MDARYLWQDMLHPTIARYLAYRHYAAVSKRSLLLFWDKIFNNSLLEIKNVAGNLKKKKFKITLKQFLYTGTVAGPIMNYVLYHKIMCCITRLCVVSQEYVLYHKIMCCITELCAVSQDYVLYHKIMCCITKLCTVSQNCVLYHKIMCCITRLCAVSQNYVRYHKIMCCITKLCTVSQNYVLYHKIMCCITRLRAVSENYVLYHKIPYYIGISFEVLSLYII
jgi:hypothetical protein